MKVRTTRRADRDIVGLYVDGAYKFGIEQAERYLDGLTTLFASLAENPAMARLRRELSRPIRLFPYKSHIVAYVEHGDGILIVRVLHGRQAWERHLS